jgi:hypothetical protein
VTLLPAPEREIGYGPQEPYDVPPYCAVPGCNKDAVDTHEIVRRSFAGGVKWYVVLDGVTVGNRVGICRPHHRDVTGDVGGHRAKVWWDAEARQFLWLERHGVGWEALDELNPRGVEWEALGELDPHPPVHESLEGGVNGSRVDGPEMKRTVQPRGEAAPPSEELP